MANQEDGRTFGGELKRLAAFVEIISTVRTDALTQANDVLGDDALSRDDLAAYSLATDAIHAIAQGEPIDDLLREHAEAAATPIGPGLLKFPDRENVRTLLSPGEEVILSNPDDPADKNPSHTEETSITFHLDPDARHNMRIKLTEKYHAVASILSDQRYWTITDKDLQDLAEEGMNLDKIADEYPEKLLIQRKTLEVLFEARGTSKTKESSLKTIFTQFCHKWATNRGLARAGRLLPEEGNSLYLTYDEALDLLAYLDEPLQTSKYQLTLQQPDAIGALARKKK